MAAISASQILTEIKVKPLLELKNDPFTHAVSFYLVIGVAGKVKK